METTVGVLALQGDFAEHCAALEKCGVRAVQIRHSWQLKGLSGLIIPGGESTAIDKLTSDNGDPIFDTIRALALAGLPIYGTCMGSIFVAKEIEGSSQRRLGLMDIRVRRNAFGPQKCSFETSIVIPALGNDAFPCVFIRGPVISWTAPEVEVLAKIDDHIVMARQNNLLVTAFHPEITDDMRVHQLFVQMVHQYDRNQYDGNQYDGNQYDGNQYDRNQYSEHQYEAKEKRSLRSGHTERSQRSQDQGKPESCTA